MILKELLDTLQGVKIHVCEDTTENVVYRGYIDDYLTLDILYELQDYLECEVHEIYMHGNHLDIVVYWHDKSLIDDSENSYGIDSGYNDYDDIDTY